MDKRRDPLEAVYNGPYLKRYSQLERKWTEKNVETKEIGSDSAGIS